MSTVIVILLLIVIAVLLARRARGQLPTASPQSEEPAPQASPWHCVAIKRGKNSCPAARALAGKRFLPGEAPRLPLAECTNDACECSYVHFKDRRHLKRRTEDVGLATAHYPGQERREPQPDRRHDHDVEEEQPRTEASDYFNR